MTEPTLDTIPIFLRKEWIGLENVCEQLQLKYSSYLDIGFDNLVIHFKSLKEGSTYYYRITNPQLDHGKTYVKIDYKPQTDMIDSAYSAKAPMESVISNSITNWIDLVKQDFELSGTRQERKQRLYEEEYYEQFKSVDEDAAYAYYSEEVQLELFKRLTHLERQLEEFRESNSLTAPIVEEVQLLKKYIPTLTKQQTASRLSKIYALMRKAGLFLLENFWKVVKDEGFKELLKHGKAAAKVVIDHYK